MAKILNMPVVTGAADTAVVKTLDVAKWVSTVSTATTLTINHTDAAGGAKTIVMTLNGTDAAEKQLNVDKCQNFVADLMSGAALPVTYATHYKLGIEEWIKNAGLVFTGASTKPLTSVAINL